MAELLIKAQEPWNNDSPTAPSNRSRLGDIIVVRPDGWQWGNEENLPRFIVVKLPGITIDAVKKYEEQLIDATNPQNPVMLKVRKYQVPNSYMTNAINAGNSVITINVAIAQIAFMNNIIEKTS